MECSICKSNLKIGRLECPRCSVRYEGDFTLPRLARLPASMQQLAEQVVLAAGNLKEVARWQDVSYPTLRKRVDVLIDSLEALRHEDDATVERLLAQVENGEVLPEYAARRIGELQHGN